MKNVFMKQKLQSKVWRNSTAAERIEKLKAFDSAYRKAKRNIQDALFADFGKHPTETELTEIFPVLSEIKHTIGHLKNWMKPVSVSNPLAVFGTRGYVYYEAKGTTLIIGPWNYPMTLTVVPIVSAVAAGNTCMVKPSEFTFHSNAVLKEILAQVFAESEVAVIQGGVDTTTELLTYDFDHIFFTGSTSVGKIVAQAAAKNLIPVTLELGGKSPAILDRSADVDQAAEKIVWGKFVNAGQTCVAPDYVLVPKSLESDLIQSMTRYIQKFYGESAAQQKASKDLARIISDRHFSRLESLLNQTVKEGAKIIYGGERDGSSRYVGPTILTEVKQTSAIMKEEIFGPILPVIHYENIEEVYSYVENNSKPLALYVFGQDVTATEQIIQQTKAGGTCVNNTVVHLANPNLPFGGVGTSGWGSYHGHFGFKTFSHERAVLKQSRFNSFRNFYPPYNEKMQKAVKLAMRFFT